MTILQVLQTTGLPCVYSHFRKKEEAPKRPPYIVYIGAGQENFSADDTYYYRQNSYQVEYYFTEKNEAEEEKIENALLENGYYYTKSDDIYVEDEDVFVIYYDVI